MIRRAARGLAPAALAFALTGCISLFPKQEPSQLYTFGETAGPSQPSGQPARYAVLMDTIGFDRIAGTDRILTVSGNEVAYVKGARWAAPAPMLFRSAEQRAFDLAGGPARLIQPGEASHADAVLKVDVLRFEARYDGGAGAAPTVVVRVHAALNKGADHAFIGERVFEAKIPASDNRMGPITAAFDQATDQVLGDLVTWVNGSGG
jgi:cholesterol transport system auxiliary component